MECGDVAGVSTDILMNLFVEHGREFLEPALLALVSGYFGVKADGYWSAFFNATGVCALWVFPAMYLDTVTMRDVPGIAYIISAPIGGIVAVIVRSVAHLACRITGREFPRAAVPQRSCLVTVPAWSGRILGVVWRKVFLRVNK